MVQALAANGAPLNLGSAAQFSENTFYTSKGFSSYNALLVSLQKNLSARVDVQRELHLCALHR